MPRAGLSQAVVVDAAIRLADRDGVDAVSIAAVAAEVGVRPPSLYNHVASRDELVSLMAQRTLQEIVAALSLAGAGLAGDDALLAVARAQRAYALAHPGAYAATERTVAQRDERVLTGGGAVVDVLLAVLRGYGLEGEAGIHAVRTTRAAIHGFVALELAGGFQMDVDVEASFTWAMRALGAGLRAAAAGETAG